MKYSEFVEVYEKLSSTTKKIEKTTILANFLRELKRRGAKSEWTYLLNGRVLPDYDSREFGISRQLAFKAISKAFGIKQEKVIEEFNKVGDLGEIAEKFIERKRQSALFSNTLTVEKVFENLKKIVNVSGKGAIDKKLAYVSELLTSATGKEGKYIIRTLLNDLRIGVAEGILRDALAEAFFEDEKKEMVVKIEDAYDLVNDFAYVFDAAIKGKKAFEKINIVVGKPIKVMLPVKVTEISEAFRICGKPAAIEHKYDGFRMLINKDGEKISLFTRKLENVTSQFPDVVDYIKNYVQGNSFILDTEVVGYNPVTKKYQPFEAISQRIKRKYDIEKLIKKLPVEVNVFDVVFYNGKSLMETPFIERRKIVEKIIKPEQYKIRPSYQIITDDEKEAEKFYKEALKIGEEGIMIKRLDAPYKQGRRVGYIVKLKPAVNDLDLVIVGAEYGSGKRAGLLTSYIVACRDNGNFLEVGRVSSGLKDKEEEGTSYEEMTDLLKPLIIKKEGNTVRVLPKIVVSVTYQNIQKSPSYTSGYAMRFPRITAYRPDRHIKDIATLEDIKKESKK